MIEVHNIPTSVQYVVTASYIHRIDNKTLATPVDVIVVFYQTESEGSETNKVGDTIIGLISQSQMLNKASDSDTLTIDSQKYKILKQKLVKVPGMVPYWKSDLKSV